MLVVTSVVAWLALLLSVITFILHLSARKKDRSPVRRSLWDDEQLLQMAWMQELETRGEALLDQFAEAERRLRQSVGPIQAAPKSVERMSDVPDDHSVDNDEPVISYAHRTNLLGADVKNIVRDVSPPSSSDVSVVDQFSADVSTDVSAEDDGATVDDFVDGQGDDRVQRVQQLAAKGKDVATIARLLDIGSGEVELILALSGNSSGQASR